MRVTELSSPPQTLPWTKADVASGATRAAAVSFTIGQLAQEFGLTPRTLRFYESLVLLSPQREGAARLYSQADHDRIALIVRGKSLGFTLREIRELLAAPGTGSDQPALHLTRAQCVEQIKLLERQKQTIEKALVELRRTYSSIYAHALACEISGGSDDGH